MNTEEKLKNFIRSKYGSVNEFTKVIEMPYSTIATIFSRGIETANVTTLLKICKALGIVADELIEGRIVPAGTDRGTNTELVDVVQDFKIKIMTFDNLAIDGDPVGEIERLAIVQALDKTLELIIKPNTLRDEIKKYRDFYNKNYNKIP